MAGSGRHHPRRLTAESPLPAATLPPAPERRAAPSRPRPQGASRELPEPLVLRRLRPRIGVSLPDTPPIPSPRAPSLQPSSFQSPGSQQPSQARPPRSPCSGLPTLTGLLRSRGPSPERPLWGHLLLRAASSGPGRRPARPAPPPRAPAPTDPKHLQLHSHVAPGGHKAGPPETRRLRKPRARPQKLIGRGALAFNDLIPRSHSTSGR